VPEAVRARPEDAIKTYIDLVIRKFAGGEGFRIVPREKEEKRYPIPVKRLEKDVELRTVGCWHAPQPMRSRRARAAKDMRSKNGCLRVSAESDAKVRDNGTKFRGPNITGPTEGIAHGDTKDTRVRCRRGGVTPGNNRHRTGANGNRLGSVVYGASPGRRWSKRVQRAARKARDLRIVVSEAAKGKRMWRLGRGACKDDSFGGR
jgi:hypothetical protein